MGTGRAARNFVVGLRRAAGAEVLVVGSRSRDRGADFAERLRLRCAVDDHAGVVERPVDAIYIATPPSTHRDFALMCLRARKAVLVEKPFGVDAEQAREIADAARSTSVFCMEAMWTRFLPLLRRVRRMVDAGSLGAIVSVTASFGTPETNPVDPIWNPSLGGGALLDRGVYPLSLATQLLGRPAHVSAEAAVSRSGVDEDVACVMRYDGGALVVFQASLRGRLHNDLLMIGSRGRVQIGPPIYRPSVATAQWIPSRPSSPRAGSRSRLTEHGWAHAVRQRVGRIVPVGAPFGVTTLWEPYQGNGYHYQAVELMRCVREGRAESAVMPLSESVLVMETADRIRASWSRLTGPAKRDGSGTAGWETA
jgi:predicted dehydrogenase